MLKGCRVDLDPASRVSQWTVAHDIEPHLWWDDMDHVETHLKVTRFAIFVGHGKQRRLRRPVDGDQVVLIGDLDAISVDRPLQWRNEKGTPNSASPARQNLSFVPLSRPRRRK